MQQPPSVVQKASLPPGIMPKNAQAWLILGLAAFMMLVIFFSDRSAPKPAQPKDKLAPPAAIDPNQARIQEYRARIEEQSRKLASEQAQLAQAKQSLISEPPARTSELPLRPIYEPAPTPPEKSWIDQDREKREYQSRYSSNLALNLRAAGNADAEPPRRPHPTPPASQAAASGAPSTSEEADKKKEALNKSEGKTYRLSEGTVLEAVLTNRLDGAFSGPVNCMVSANIYSHNRQHILIPQGSRVLGEAKRVDTFGQQRLAVVFHRLIMPDGYSVSLDQFKGLSQVGETGLRDKVNHHYLQIFGVSLAIGAIAGLSQANTRYSFDSSALDAYRQGVASSLSQSSLRILDRYLNVLPTFMIREGQRIKVYLSDDLYLPAYENHRMPDDL